MNKTTNKKEQTKKAAKPTVNIFFSCDDAYVPFLAAALYSMEKNADKKRDYDIKILHAGISGENVSRIIKLYNKGKFAVSAVDISKNVDWVADKLHTRDYYSKSTYYRLFIPELYPDIGKALYLDSDIIVKGDISELFDIEMGDCLVGGASDQVVNNNGEFIKYAKNRLGFDNVREYFNAGILLMNLDALRKFDFCNVFIKVLSSVTFTVAQDQDYLNVICKGRVKYFGSEWNRMPIENNVIEAHGLCLLHYCIDLKPWHRDGVMYASYFWNYAEKCGYYDEINKIKQNFSAENVIKSGDETFKLKKTAEEQAADDDENRRIASVLEQYVGGFVAAH